MSISQRVSQLNVSGIRKVFDLAAKMKNPVNLSIGQPDFDVPERIKESAITHIRSGKNKYTLSAGIPELREKLKKFLAVKAVNAEDILITSGVSGGLLLAIMSLVDPGDEVIVPDPAFMMYNEVSKLFGAKVVLLDTYPDFLMDPEKLKALITPKTKLLFLNSPGNPTGRVLVKERLKQIAEVLKNTGIWVIADDIYDYFDYDGLHSVFAPFYERTLTLGGFSKSSGMPGWRAGYAAGPREVIDAMIRVQQYTFVCAPSFAQYACLDAVDEFSNDAQMKLYRRKRDFVYTSLKDKYEIVRPEGAFYFFMRHPHLDGDKLVDKALEKEVLIIPGSVFSSKNSHFRLSFANSDSELKRGMERLLDIN